MPKVITKEVVKAMKEMLRGVYIVYIIGENEKELDPQAFQKVRTCLKYADHLGNKLIHNDFEMFTSDISEYFSNLFALNNYTTSIRGLVAKQGSSQSVNAVYQVITGLCMALKGAETLKGYMQRSPELTKLLTRDIDEYLPTIFPQGIDAYMADIKQYYLGFIQGLNINLTNSELSEILKLCHFIK